MSGIFDSFDRPVAGVENSTRKEVDTSWQMPYLSLPPLGVQASPGETETRTGTETKPNPNVCPCGGKM